jgi:hypothetical protein
MANINIESLAETLDAVNESFFYGKKMTESDRIQTAGRIASRIGKPGCYAGMAAPTGNDFSNGVRTFTGEWVRLKAGTGHTLGEEACRALIQLNVQESTIKEALQQATQGMLQRLMINETPGDVQGLYCCGTCSVAYWRHVTVGGLDKNEARLTAAMKALKSLHSGDGRWRRFPFPYTLLALSEMDSKLAIEEMRYAAPVIERQLKRSLVKDAYSRRRQIIYERILTKC